VIATLSVAAVALAATDHIYNGGLSAGNSYASTTAHSSDIYTEVVSDHTACGGFDQGHAGSFGGPPLVFALSTCGPGTTRFYANGCCSGSYYHGAVFNPNSSTFDNISNSYFAY
jgi:hypothetical protein